MFRLTKKTLRYLSKPLLAIMLGCSISPATFAYYQDYLPAGFQSVKTIPQTTVALNFDHDWKAKALPGIEAVNCEGQFSVSGLDNKGMPWKIDETEPRDFGGSCYTADVDGNGKLDIILHFPNASCGYPFSSLVIILIDQNGLPHREEIISRFSADKNGVADIVRAPSGKGSYILGQDLAYGKIANRDCGYWRWSVLFAANSKLTEVTTAFNTKLPCYVFFTNKPNHLLSSHGAALERQYRQQR